MSALLTERGEGCYQKYCRVRDECSEATAGRQFFRFRGIRLWITLVAKGGYGKEHAVILMVFERAWPYRWRSVGWDGGDSAVLGAAKPKALRSCLRRQYRVDSCV